MCLQPRALPPASPVGREGGWWLASACNSAVGTVEGHWLHQVTLKAPGPRAEPQLGLGAGCLRKSLVQLEFRQQGPIHRLTHLTLNPSLCPDFCPSFQASRHTSTIHWLIHPFVAHLPIYSSISWPTHSQVYPSIHPFNHLYIPLSSHPTYECGSHLSTMYPSI